MQERCIVWKEGVILLNDCCSIVFFPYEEANDGVFKILGRTSVDIIKSSGYKIRYSCTF